jgi:hypothetical protein
MTENRAESGMPRPREGLRPWYRLDHRRGRLFDEKELTMNRSTTRRPFRILGLALALAGSAVVLNGCNDAQAGALLGAGIGALAGQAAGGDTEATLIGTGIGTGVGYIIGNESDKAKQRDYYRRGNYDY